VLKIPIKREIARAIITDREKSRTNIAAKSIATEVCNILDM
jgi:hypothetical protein